MAHRGFSIWDLLNDGDPPFQVDKIVLHPIKRSLRRTKVKFFSQKHLTTAMMHAGKNRVVLNITCAPATHRICIFLYSLTTSIFVIKL